MVAETLGRRETLRALLQDHGFRPEIVGNWGEFLAGAAPLGITVAQLEKGLVLGVITSYSIHYTKLYELRRHGDVLAFCSARPNDGGTGVV